MIGVFRPLVITLCALAGATQACSPPSFDIGMVLPGFRVATEGCAVKVYEGRNSGFRVEEAKDLGDGIFIQRMYEGDPCLGGREALVVANCNTAQAVRFDGKLFGYDQLQAVPDALAKHVPWTEYQSETDLLVAFAEANDVALTPQSLAAFADEEAEMIGVAWETMSVKTRARVLNRRVDLACGCRHFFPGSEGAKK